MIKLLILCCLTLVLATGCLFSKSSDRSKRRTPVTAEVQETFQKRWVDRRVSELVAQGIEAGVARVQAEQEFHATYNFSSQAGAK